MTNALRYVLTASAGLAAAVALAACGSGTSTGADHGSMPGMGASTPAASSATAGASGTSGASGSAVHNQADVTFATGMIPHHQQAVQMAEMALKQAVTPQVKDLATQVKAAQDPEIKTMSGWLTAWGQPVPTAMAGHDMSQMGGGMEGMMSDQEMQQLGAASGSAFDRMWLQMMIKHHQGAVAMATTETQQGSSADAKALAGQIITAQNKEISQMQQLLPVVTGSR